MLREHDARVRAGVLAEAASRNAAAEADALRARAESASAAAAASQAQVQSLIEQEKQIAAASRQLQAALLAAQSSLRAREQEVQTMPIDQIVAKLREQLGPGLTAAQGTAGVTLNESAARKVQTCFVDLDGCREQTAIKDQQITALGRQVTTGQSIAAAQEQAIQNLRAVAQAKDDLLVAREKEFEAEVKTAKGSALTRFWNRVKFPVGIGLGITATVLASKAN
jgi:hypothetical protein